MITFILATGLTVGILVAFATMPSWLSRNYHRQKLWALRDEVFDARRSGALPDHKDVSSLLRKIEFAIASIDELSMPSLIFAAREFGGMDRSEIERFLAEDQRRRFFVGMTGDQKALMRAYDSRYASALITSVFSSTWFGLFSGVGVMAVAALRAGRDVKQVALDSRFVEDSFDAAEMEIASAVRRPAAAAA